jgi:hypothetical protein
MRLTSKAGARIRNILNSLSEVTGGKAFYPSSRARMEQVFAQISLELRHRDSIGNRPTDVALDGKWHRVKVKVFPPAGSGGLVVRSRRGYYARTRAGRMLRATPRLDGLSGFSYAFK